MKQRSSITIQPQQAVGEAVHRKQVYGNYGHIPEMQTDVSADQKKCSTEFTSNDSINTVETYEEVVESLPSYLDSESDEPHGKKVNGT